MKKRLARALAGVLALSMFFQQAGFAQGISELNFSKFFAPAQQVRPLDNFRPLHLRYFSFDPANQSFNLLLDKGDSNGAGDSEVTQAAQTVFEYFLTGIALPNDSFWVNLRPDSEDEIVDPLLARTDMGKVMLEADLQLKRDTAQFTSPQNPQGKVYWDKLYKKAGELFGTQNVTIPTLTRPWIVPGEVIIRYTDDSAYIYKAGLKVMLEQDYLKNSSTYSFADPRLKTLNEYSSQLIRELIIPELNKEINSAKRYSGLRQVFYSLILAQWFKQQFQNTKSQYASRIDRKDLSGLTSQQAWSKETYFRAYQKSFKDGEYNLKEPVTGLTGQTIRSYFSGGEAFQNTLSGGAAIAAVGSPLGQGDNFAAAVAGNPAITAAQGAGDGQVRLTEAPKRKGADSRGVDGLPNDTYTPDILDAFAAPLVNPYSAFSIPLITDEETIQAIEGHMMLVQPGKDYLKGQPQVKRTASLINFMWTDLLRDGDSVGVRLHQRKLPLTRQFTQALKDKNFEVAAACLIEYAKIRDELCRRWLALALDAHNGLEDLPSYAYEYQKKMFERQDYDVLRDLYRQHGDKLRYISPYTLEPIVSLSEAARKEGIAIFPLGAGGPGAVCIAVDPQGVVHLREFFEKRGLHKIDSQQAGEIIRGEGKYATGDTVAILAGYTDFKVGREPLTFRGFNDARLTREGIKLPKGPIRAVYNEQDGSIRGLQAGKNVPAGRIEGLYFKPRFNFVQGRSLDTSVFRPGGIFAVKRDAQAVRRIIAWARENQIPLEIEGHLRGVDGCGSSLDLPEFQVRLTNEGAKLVMELPSTPTIASDFKVSIKFEWLEGEGAENKIVYVAPDYFKGERVTEGQVQLSPHADAKKRAWGMMMTSQANAPAYIFRNLFGLGGIKITCGQIEPLALAGGMESSNVFNVALIAAASMLSGSDLNLAEIFNLAVKLENDELNGLTGGQGHIGTMLGRAFQHIWLSGIRDMQGARQFAACQFKNGQAVQTSFLIEERSFGRWNMPAAYVQMENQIKLHPGQLERLQRALTTLGVSEKTLGTIIFLRFSHGKRGHYSLSRNQTFLDISLLDAGRERDLLMTLYHDLMEPYMIRVALNRDSAMRSELEATKNSPEIRSPQLKKKLQQLSQDVHQILLQREFYLFNLWLALTRNSPDFLEKNSITFSHLESATDAMCEFSEKLSSDSHAEVPDLARIHKGFAGIDVDLLIRGGGLPVDFNPGSGSGMPVPTTERAFGGIDLRYINMISQPQLAALKQAFKMPDLNALKGFNLEVEGKELEKLMAAGIVPSSQRLMEYISACYLRSPDMDAAVGCLVGFFKLEEERCLQTPAEFKAFLAVIESEKLAI